MISFDLIRTLFPHSTPKAPKDIIEQAIAAPAEVREQTNPYPSWLERTFCVGYKKSEFFCKDKSSVHPLTTELEAEGK